MGWYIYIQGQSSLQMPSPMYLYCYLPVSKALLKTVELTIKINHHIGLDASAHVLFRQTALILGLALVPTSWLP